MPYKDREEQKAYQRAHYLRYKDTYDNRNRDKRKKLRDLINSFKTECSKCGYNECKQALQFHHINGDKKFNISEARGRTEQRVLEEIRKCILICANCHAKEHCTI